MRWRVTMHPRTVPSIAGSAVSFAGSSAGGKCRGALCIKLLRNCRVVAAAHCTGSGTFSGCTGPRVTMLLPLFR